MKILLKHLFSKKKKIVKHEEDMQFMLAMEIKKDGTN